MTAPPRPFHGDASTRVLLEVVRQDRPSVPSIARALGQAKSTVHTHLRNLRVLGLVTWTDGAVGTLRALVHEIPLQVVDVDRAPSRHRRAHDAQRRVSSPAGPVGVDSPEASR